MIPPVDGLAAFGAAVVAAGLLAAYLLVGEPLVGTVLHRRFEAALGHDRGARLWLYRRLLVLEWGLVALVAGVVLVAPLGWSDLGLRLPDASPTVLAVAIALFVLSFLVLSTGMVRTAARRDRHDAPALGSASPSVTALVPRTRVERRWFGLVAVSAGVCEEVLYRGFLLGVVVAVLPGLPALGLVVLGGLIFGLAHAYQGATGIATTAVLGAILTYLYVGTGTLLVPIVVHAAIDLRILWLPLDALPPDPAQRGSAGSAPA